MTQALPTVNHLLSPRHHALLTVFHERNENTEIPKREIATQQLMLTLSGEDETPTLNYVTQSQLTYEQRQR